VELSQIKAACCFNPFPITKAQYFIARGEGERRIGSLPCHKISNSAHSRSLLAICCICVTRRLLISPPNKFADALARTQKASARRFPHSLSAINFKGEPRLVKREVAAGSRRPHSSSCVVGTALSKCFDLLKRTGYENSRRRPWPQRVQWFRILVTLPERSCLCDCFVLPLSSRPRKCCEPLLWLLCSPHCVYC
jgi:hypothetical protein